MQFLGTSPGNCSTAFCPSRPGLYYLRLRIRAMNKDSIFVLGVLASMNRSASYLLPRKIRDSEKHVGP